MRVPKFSEKELKVVDVIPESPFMGTINLYDYPVTPREAIVGLFNREPVWQVLNYEFNIFTPRIWPDYVSRGWVFDSQPFDPDTEAGGTDMFGVEWVYVPVAMGSMVKPGNPLLTDANEWREVIKFPDIDAWDWAGSAQENNGSFLTPSNYNQVWMQTGWFERLISFMDFVGAAIALIDSEQQQAIKELFDALTTLYIDIIDHYVKHFSHIDGFLIHDDWGSQQNSFFAPALAEGLIVPYMQRVTDHIHKLGLFADFHSCGKIENQVPNIIKAGWDAWTPQTMNDTAGIHAKYGNRLIIAATPDPLPEGATEEEQRAAARAYAARYCIPSKPTYVPVYGMEMLTPAFREELYVQSRMLYSA